MAVFAEGTVTSVTTTATGPDPMAQTRQRLRRTASDSLPDRVALAILAIVAYLPLLVTRVGAVALDTADGLYLDQARTLRLSGGRWDPGIMLGSITDRTDGHAFPMAPWYWLADVVGLPTWLAQRLWLGTLIMLAGAGVLVLLRTMTWAGPGKLAAAVAYMLSPYAYQYLGNRSALLLAWAGLPWLVHFAARGLVARGWSDPARFALVAALATGGNLAATLYLMVGPFVWFVYQVVGVREVPLRIALRAAWRTALIGVGVAVWLVMGWAYSPRLELDQALNRDPGRFVRRATVPSDVIRGLGDWRTATDPGGARAWFHSSPLVIAVGYVVPAVALVAVTMSRFRHRLYFVALLLAGMTLSVGAGPGDRPEAFGRLVGDITGTTIGGILTPTSRAVPLIALSCAVGFGAGVRAIIRWRPALWWAAQFAAGTIVVLAVPGFVLGRSLDGPALLSSGVPAYWRQAASAVNGLGDVNVLEISPTAAPSYLWGTPHLPISASLFNAPVAVRTNAPIGQRAVRDLVAAIDDHLRSGTLEPAAIAPLARLMGVGGIVVPLDGPDAQGSARLVELLTSAPDVSLLGRYGGTPEDSSAPGVAVFRVTDVPQRLRLAAADRLFAADLDGRGLVSLANAGLLRGDEVLLGGDPSDLRTASSGRALPILMTDGHRREHRRITDVVGSVGPTEPDGEAPWGRPDGERLNAPERTTSGSLAVAVLDGGVMVRASSFGTSERLDPASRPTLVVDGDPSTSWLAGKGAEAVGERVSITFPDPVTSPTLRLVQPTGSPAITAVHLEFDGFLSQEVAFDGGEATVELDVTRFRTLSIVIAGLRPDADPAAAVGFAEAQLAGVGALNETVVLPDDLMRIGDPLRYRALQVVLTRWRDAVGGQDPERELRRGWSSPVALRFEITGQARLAEGAAPPAPGCVGGLVTVNGRDVPVSLSADGERLAVRGCEPIDVDSGPITVLGAGRDEPIVIDRLILAAAPVEAVPVDPVVAPLASTAQVTTEGTTTMRVKLAAASPSVWLFRAAASSDGWIADIDGDDIGASRPANAFGGAWQLPIGDGKEHTVTLRIPAQRRVGIGVIASGVAAVVALVLAFRRRELVPGESPTAGHVLGHQAAPSAAVVAMIVLLGVAGGVAPMAVAIAYALLHEYRRGRIASVAGLAPGAVLLATGLARAAWSVVSHVSPADWPTSTPWADILTWCAVALAAVMAARPPVRPIRPVPVDRRRRSDREVVGVG